ncbi:MAG TPA: sugar phosphate isomerase/epimerase family protein [Anaerolineae bacterium]|nr:sugar phosphate isomerase/epimerase family protein [Anaerolineae bacterium]HPL29705.1 sugar phosphate isomerase/epimerase family protein [Anaerolineae bacterium]
MNLMICLTGESEQLAFLPEIATLGAGIELGSYGLTGVRSERDWEARLTLHKAVRAQFRGTLAVHGPFIGIEYAHVDHLLREAVNRRLDMTFDMAVGLKASRVVLHSGYKPEVDLFGLEDFWLQGCTEFWQREIRRWADAGIAIVIENNTERTPDLLIRLVDQVDHPFLGLCLDIGHQHLFSDLDALEWVRRMDERLLHIHLHDNDGSGDRHWPLGRGTIDLEPFYTAIARQVPQATISLEVEDAMQVKMGDLRKLAARFAPERG